MTDHPTALETLSARTERGTCSRKPAYLVQTHVCIPDGVPSLKHNRTTVTSAGTPAYMAPELLEDRPFSKSVDLYAFGILLWEVRWSFAIVVYTMCAGLIPFHATVL